MATLPIVWGKLAWQRLLHVTAVVYTQQSWQLTYASRTQQRQRRAHFEKTLSNNYSDFDGLSVSHNLWKLELTLKSPEVSHI